jgi:hypothetical protein
LSDRLEKEKRLKAIQTNLDDFDPIDGTIQEDERVWGAQSIQQALKPIDWTMMESLKTVINEKKPIAEIVETMKLKRSSKPMSPSVHEEQHSDHFPNV